MILIVIIAVIVTIFTAGAAAGLMGYASVAAAATAGATGVVATALFVGGVVGSAVSQVAAKEMGMREHFSLREAFSSGLTNMLTGGTGGGNWVDIAAQAATNYVVDYAVNKVTKAREVHFQWSGLATSVVGAVAADKLNTGMFGPQTDQAAQQFSLVNYGRSFVSAATVATVGRLINNEGKQHWGQIAANSFANVTGSLLGKKAALALEESGFAEAVKPFGEKVGKWVEASPIASGINYLGKGIVELHDAFKTGFDYVDKLNLDQRAMSLMEITSSPSLNVVTEINRNAKDVVATANATKSASRDIHDSESWLDDPALDRKLEVEHVLEKNLEKISKFYNQNPSTSLQESQNSLIDLIYGAQIDSASIELAKADGDTVLLDKLSAPVYEAYQARNSQESSPVVLNILQLGGLDTEGGAEYSPNEVLDAYNSGLNVVSGNAYKLVQEINPYAKGMPQSTHLDALAAVYAASIDAGGMEGLGKPGVMGYIASGASVVADLFGQRLVSAGINAGVVAHSLFEAKVAERLSGIGLMSKHDASLLVSDASYNGYETAVGEVATRKVGAVFEVLLGVGGVNNAEGATRKIRASSSVDAKAAGSAGDLVNNALIKVRHRAGNSQVELNGQRWHLPAGKTVNDIPVDTLGDELEKAAKQVAGSWNKSKLSDKERQAIAKAYRAAKEDPSIIWKAKRLEQQAKGRYVEKQVKEQFQNGISWSGVGVDATDKATGIKYDVMSGTKYNMDLHAKRMPDVLFRMITF